jgi:hypothetical protein
VSDVSCKSQSHIGRASGREHGASITVLFID